jgi:hypothetical protein
MAVARHGMVGERHGNGTNTNPSEEVHMKQSSAQNYASSEFDVQVINEYRYASLIDGEYVNKNASLGDFVVVRTS